MSGNIQGPFLGGLTDRTVTVITVNGYQLKGRIVGHDQYTILLEVDGKRQLIYKSAVSTVKEA